MLAEQDRQKLDGIVQQMTTNKEPDSNIQAVVNDFKTKYDSGSNGASQLTPTPAPLTPDQQSAQEFKPTFAANTENPSLAEPLKAVGNVPSSAVGFAKGAAGFLNPARSVPQVANSLAGIAGSIPGAIEDTSGGTYTGKAADAAKVRAMANTAPVSTPSTLLGTQAGNNPMDLIADTAIEAGKGIYQAVVPKAAQQLISGDTKSAQRTITNDPVGQIAPFLLGAHEASGGDGGAVDNAMSKTSSAVTEPIKAVASKLPVPDILTKDPATLRTDKMTQGLEEQNSRLKSADNSFNNNTKTYANPDGTTKTVTPIDTFTSLGLTPDVVKGKLDMGNYKTGDGVLGQLKSNIQGLDAQIDSTLKNTGKQADIDVLRQDAIDQAKNNPTLKQAGKVQQTINQINTRFDDYKQSYGDKIDIAEINNIRKVANKDFNPDTMDASRIVGDTARDVVYHATDDMAVRDMLRKQGEMLAARDYADSVHGTAVTGGRLGNYAMRQAGATIGSTLDKLPVVGPLLGALGGDALARILQQSQFRSFGADLKDMGKAAASKGSALVQGAKDINEFKKPLPVGLSVEDVTKQQPYIKDGKVYIPGQKAVPVNRYTSKQAGAFPKSLRQAQTLSADESFQPRPVLK